MLYMVVCLGLFQCTRRISVSTMTAVAKEPQEEDHTTGKYVLVEYINLFIY